MAKPNGKPSACENCGTTQGVIAHHRGHDAKLCAKCVKELDQEVGPRDQPQAALPFEKPIVSGYTPRSTKEECVRDILEQVDLLERGKIGTMQAMFEIYREYKHVAGVK